MKKIIIEINSLLLLSYFLFLIGCSAGNAPTPTRDILVTNQIASEGYGAYGYLILMKRPSDTDTTLWKRYSKVCNAYLSNMEPNSFYPDKDSSELMPTYWLADTIKFDEESYDCFNWVSNYDYARAKTVASSIGKLYANGPILVAWSKPFEKVGNQEEALILDLSKFADEDIDRAFGIWMAQISKNKEVWHDGFNLTLAREGFRNFFEKYGAQIIDSIKTVKEVLS